LLKLRVSARGQHAVLFGVCALVLLWRCALVFSFGIIGDRTYIASDTRFDSMLFGCALAVWYNPALDLQPRKPSWLALGGAAAGGLLLLTSFVVRDPAFRESARYTLQGLGLYPLFFLAISQPALLPMRVLNLRLVRFLGTLSYSLYLLHQVMIHLVWGAVTAPNALRAAIALALSLVISLALWRFIEKPCARLRSRLSRASVQSPALALPAVR
jgi:peptidoglycan/LPS O-acetylase OafA/YrhL